MSSDENINLSNINFSNAYGVTVRKFIGQQLKTICLFPVLKMKTISLTFHVDGKTHLLDIVRNNECKDLEKEHMNFFIRGFPMISGFLAFLKSKFLSFDSI